MDKEGLIPFLIQKCIYNPRLCTMPTSLERVYSITLELEIELEDKKIRK